MLSAWIIPLSADSKIHFSTLDSRNDVAPIWRCRTKRVRAAKDRGVGVREGVTSAMLHSRKPCANCISCMIGEAYDLGKMLENEVLSPLG